jgi:hypothetical protein
MGRPVIRLIKESKVIPIKSDTWDLMRLVTHVIAMLCESDNDPRGIHEAECYALKGVLVQVQTIT